MLENILEKIITSDIISVAELKAGELPIIRRLIKFVGSSGVNGISYTSVAQNIAITKYKAEQYLELLEQTFVLYWLFPAGTNVLKEPKVLMRLPYRLLYSDYESAIGGIMEDYTVGALSAIGVTPFYLKSMRGAKTPDFLVKFGDKDFIVKVGGKRKGREQFKGIDVKEKIILTHSELSDDIKYPLFMLGFVDSV